jgi:Fe-S oxidoreductase
LKKSLKVFSEPRAVIDATPGCTLTEMAEPDWCCGMGGSFNLQYYDISKGIGHEKGAQIKATGADTGHGMPGLHDPDLRHALPGRCERGRASPH